MSGTLTLNPGNIDLITDPSTPSSGSILKNGVRFIHDGGNSNNTFLGLYAGNFTMTGGGGNTASGHAALFSNTTGDSNTASGASALSSNTTGSYNTASGNGALLVSTTASQNTADGWSALRSNTTGFNNTASGFAALFSNTTGGNNTASGWSALFSNTTGNDNTASGAYALYSNTTGTDNTASGVAALRNTTGFLNIGIGSLAGSNLTTGSNNIDIGSQGVGGESDTIRIGDVQTAAFIAGISGATTAAGVAVFVNSSGQLGTLPSSARFKDDIRDLGEGSEGLLRLRPVSFRYKPGIDPTGLEQYGLIAEEVAKIYPDLVTRDDAGQAQAVRYHFLVPMLVNEVQKDRKTIEEQRLRLQSQHVQIEDVRARLARLEALLPTPAR